ncbi:MAG: chromosomal replication initiator protein DnaA [Lentisphaeria bacterium]|nr:chromosomal replication initiator protein DnaA [Lentisphaeria bacterium]
METGEDKAIRIWAVAVERLRAQSETLYDNWVSRMVPLRLEGGKIVVGVDNDFLCRFLSDHYQDLFEEALADIDGESFSIELEPGHRQEPPEKPKAEPAAPALPARPRLSADANEYTFDNFIVGEENRHAFAAALATAEEPGLYNPLFLYGANGVGKTHLLQAVARELRRRNPRLVIRDTTCDELLNDFYDLLMQKRSLSAFRSSVRDVDVLLVDDVHRLAQKHQMQEEFFNLFNTLYRQHKQIILTSDRQPCEISDIDKRLSTRFESGMISEVGMPEFEARLAMLRLWQSKMLTQNPLADEFLEFLAENISSSVRRLKAAYYRLATYSSLNGGSLTITLAEELLHAQLMQESASRFVSIESVQRAVADQFSVSIADLLGKKRLRNIAEPRMIAMYLSRRLTGRSSTEVGAAFGRNHATVLHAEKQVPLLCRDNDALRRAISQLERQLKH